MKIPEPEKTKIQISIIAARMELKNAFNLMESYSSYDAKMIYLLIVACDQLGEALKQRMEK